VFIRSERAFFGRPETHDAIMQLARANNLVIYCGSGVTIDRTGFTWERLISELLLNFAPRREKATAIEDVPVLARNLNSPQLASILYELGRRRFGRNLTDRLAAELNVILYQNSGWDAGILVRNIIRLAVAFLHLRRKVTIVTTNYDDYLETEFRAYRGELAEALHDQNETLPAYPGLKVRAIDHPVDIDNEPSTGRLPQLEIVYLHGRVSSQLNFQGSLVMSERDYHSSREKVALQLRKLFARSGGAVLVVGSSLTDIPLLAALADTQGRSPRYALLSAESTRMTEVAHDQFVRLTGYLDRRGEHLGLTILKPDFHFQVAQFCLEILMACNHPGYASPGGHLRYERRLASWWDTWHGRETRPGEPERIHKEIFAALREIESRLSDNRNGAPTDPDERFMLELWVREDPDRQRALCLWTSSAGPLLDRRVLRREELGLSSPNASVRAFAEGRPQYVSREELAASGFTGSSSAYANGWRGFLAVPIRLGVSPGQAVVELPVGVITLATTATARESRIPMDDSRVMEELVAHLFALGGRLLET
jgi:hypothetical protein